MKAPTLLRHGEHIKPEYVLPSAPNSPGVGRSTDQDRPDGQNWGVVKRYQKLERVGSNATGFGLIKAASNNTIEYIGVTSDVRGMLMLTGMIALGVGVGLGQMFLRTLIYEPITGIFDAFMITVPIFFIIWGVYMAIKCSRLELFRPEDEPVIFDRQRRRVYRIFRESHPGLRGLFQRWPMCAAEYEWELTDAEHNTTLVATGSTIMTYHTLIFIVRKSITDPTIIDSFNVGTTVKMGAESVPAVWEHIRRFMEEDGPPLPAGETITPNNIPKTLWQSLCHIGPFGTSYRRWWNENTGFMVLIHVCLPVFAPFFVCWAICSWLSYQTATPVRWPDGVPRAEEIQ
jgi:hypothetical protein